MHITPAMQQHLWRVAIERGVSFEQAAHEEEMAANRVRENTPTAEEWRRIAERSARTTSATGKR